MNKDISLAAISSVSGGSLGAVVYQMLQSDVTWQKVAIIAILAAVLVAVEIIHQQPRKTEAPTT